MTAFAPGSHTRVTDAVGWPVARVLEWPQGVLATVLVEYRDGFTGAVVRRAVRARDLEVVEAATAPDGLGETEVCP